MAQSSGTQGPFHLARLSIFNRDGFKIAVCVKRLYLVRIRTRTAQILSSELHPSIHTHLQQYLAQLYLKCVPASIWRDTFSINKSVLFLRETVFLYAVDDLLWKQCSETWERIYFIAKPPLTPIYENLMKVTQIAALQYSWLAKMLTVVEISG